MDVMKIQTQKLERLKLIFISHNTISTIVSGHWYPHMSRLTLLRLVPGVQVAVYGVPAHGGKVEVRTLQVFPHALVTSSDLELSPENTQTGPDVDVGEGVVLGPGAVHPETAGDVQVTPGEELPAPGHADCRGQRLRDGLLTSYQS